MKQGFKLIQPRPQQPNRVNGKLFSRDRVDQVGWSIEVVSHWQTAAVGDEMAHFLCESQVAVCRALERTELFEFR